MSPERVDQPRELLRVEGLSKSFGPIPILQDVSFRVPARSIVGLVGENGAGKTTLFNIITGLVRPDSGAMFYRGEAFSPRTYGQAFAMGISRVFQEQALVLNVPVYENLVLSQEHQFTRFGQFVDRGEMIRVAEKIVSDAGLDIDVRRNAGAYDFSRRQAIEIARACMAPRHLMGIEDPLVLLDEPTSALDRQDENNFFDLLARMKKHASFVFVSHRLTEVREISDTIYVMKDGRLSDALAPASADEKRLHGLMVGRERAADYYHVARQRDVDDKPVVCRVSALSDSDFKNISFELRAGEILGIGGLLDSGKSAVGKAVSGVHLPQAGTVTLDDRPPQAPAHTRARARGTRLRAGRAACRRHRPLAQPRHQPLAPERRSLLALQHLETPEGAKCRPRRDPSIRHPLGHAGGSAAEPVRAATSRRWCSHAGCSAT